MPDDAMYHGTIYFTDTTTGEEANVAVQVVMTSTHAVYTIRSLTNDRPPVTVRSDDPERFAFLRDLMTEMIRVSIPV